MRQPRRGEQLGVPRNLKLLRQPTVEPVAVKLAVELLRDRLLVSREVETLPGLRRARQRRRQRLTVRGGCLVVPSVPSPAGLTTDGALGRLGRRVHRRGRRRRLELVQSVGIRRGRRRDDDVRRRPRRIRRVAVSHHHGIKRDAAAGSLPAAGGLPLERRLGRLARANLGRGGPRGHHGRHPRAHILRDGGRGGVRVVLHLIVVHHEIVVVAPGVVLVLVLRLVVGIVAARARLIVQPRDRLLTRGRHRRLRRRATSWDDATDEKTRDRPGRRRRRRVGRTASRRGFLEHRLGIRRRRRRRGRRGRRDVDGGNIIVEFREFRSSFGFTRGLDAEHGLLLAGGGGREAHRGRGAV